MQPTKFQRFSGERGFDFAVDAIKNQKTTLGNVEAAQELCSRGQLTFLGTEDLLALEGDWSNSITFIVAGRAEVRISDFKVDECHAGQHAGRCDAFRITAKLACVSRCHSLSPS